MIGSNMIITYTRGQAVIALSSGEAEYYGLVSCVSQLFGEISLAKDWQVIFTAKVWMDATAGIAIGSRRGLGRVKHIDTMFLWVQQVVNEGRVKLGKKDTTEMLADIMTKHVPEGIMLRMLGDMGFRFAAGRHNLGLKAWVFHNQRLNPVASLSNLTHNGSILQVYSPYTTAHSTNDLC